MRPRHIALLACLLGLAALAGCGGSNGGKSDTSSSGGGSAPYKIGVAVAQTGGIAVFDQPALKGFRMGVDEVNAQGGLLGKHKITLSVKDTRSDASQSAVAAQELVGSGVNMLIVPCDGDLAIAAGQVAQEKGIPSVSLCAAAGGYTEVVGDYQFGIFPGNNYQGAVLAKFAANKGWKNGFWLNSPDSLFTKDLPEYWGQQFTKLGGTVVGHASYSLGQQDFGPIVQRIQNTNPKPDVIMTSAYEPDFPAFVQRLRSAGIQTPVLASSAVDTPTLLKIGKAANNVFHGTVGVNSPGSKLAKFDARYEKKYGQPPSGVFESVGYDGAVAIRAAVDAAKSIDPKKVRDAFAALSGVQGSTGTMTFKGTNRQAIRPLVIAQVVNGKRKAVATIELKPGEYPDVQKSSG